MSVFKYIAFNSGFSDAGLTESIIESDRIKKSHRPGMSLFIIISLKWVLHIRVAQVRCVKLIERVVITVREVEAHKKLDAGESLVVIAKDYGVGTVIVGDWRARVPLTLTQIIRSLLFFELIFQL